MLKEESEASIKRSILTYLWYNRIFCWNNESVGIYDASRGIYRKKNSIFQAKGPPDILGIYRAKPLGIEVKSRKGVLSDDQRTFLEKFRYEGGIAFVARSIDDVKRELSMVY